MDDWQLLFGVKFGDIEMDFGYTDRSITTDRLCRMSTQEFKNYITARGLTGQEIQSLRTVRRKAKNRRSACESRRRKKLYVEKLEKKIAKYKNRVNVLELENQTLREHILLQLDQHGRQRVEGGHWEVF